MNDCGDELGRCYFQFSMNVHLACWPNSSVSNLSRYFSNILCIRKYNNISDENKEYNAVRTTL